MVLQLAAAFAILATLLAMLGLYGVMAHSVTRRIREIGIRMALGAAPGRIRAMVMRELLWILGIGLVTGVPAALALSRLTESLLYGVKAYDTLAVVGSAVALTDGHRGRIFTGAPGVTRQPFASAALRTGSCRCASRVEIEL